ncbi:sensor histidine kinase YesM [Desulfitobacterium sp. LBE]|uniref:ATP-binding protein n=1 Tax=Desulfitobacterium sp. LBE TaxID=884086 RepID=UPI001198D1E7|nr:ATP-binding protein [Desulfitobacterium sp. LBE]TWH56925.1 sensor histidine kinase YesM [Desulfitobacterium sp. LBE]
MNNLIQFDPVLLLYSLLGLAAFWLYFCKLGTPRLSWPRAWAALAGLALVQTVLINNIDLFLNYDNTFYSTHNFAYMLMHLGFLFAVIRMIRNIRWDQAFYHALLLSMCTRYFEQALGAVTSFFDIFYLSFRVDSVYRVFGCLLVFLLYLMVSLLLAQYVDMRGTAPLKRTRLALISVFALALEMMNYLTVVIITSEISESNAILGMSLMELLCGFTALIFIVYNEIALKKAQEQSELTQIRILMEKQAQQYKQQQIIAASIDRKYHDLKHHLNAVKALQTNEARHEYIVELESSINSYASFCHTGNDILDTILNEKNMYCSQHNIRLILLVDGGAVSFVHATDMVAIFSNALDNAIEAVSPLTDSSLREIIVRVTTRDNWTVLRFENHSNVPLVEENGILLTTKQDSSIHGFGFKSISYAVQNYGGHCTYAMEKDLFVLNILLARPAGEV